MKYLYLHGFLSGPDSTKGKFLSQKFSKSGKELLRPDLNAGDFENLTISNQLNVVQQQIRSSQEKTVLIGSSLGSFVALLAAEKNPQVEKLILIAPALDFVNRYFRSLSPDELTCWKENGYITLYHYQYKTEKRLGYGLVKDAKNYQNLRFVSTLDTLIFHGIHDESVPYQVSLEHLQRNTNSRLVLFNSDHGLINKLDMMWRYIADFTELT
jgi:pimeloyl-ACP methyl ester carboxylesterase